MDFRDLRLSLAHCCLSCVDVVISVKFCVLAILNFICLLPFNNSSIWWFCAVHFVFPRCLLFYNEVAEANKFVVQRFHGLV